MKTKQLVSVVLALAALLSASWIASAAPLTQEGGAPESGAKPAVITLENAASLEVITKPPITYVRAIAWDPAYPNVLLIATFNAYSAWGPENLVSEIDLPPNLPGATNLLFSGDGLRLVVGAFSVRLLDPRSGEQLWETELNTAAGQALSPDGTVLAATVSTEGDLALQLWDLTTGEPVRAIGCAAFESSALAFSPSGNLLACGGWSTSARVWDVATWAQVAELGHPPELHEGRAVWSLNAVAFSPDGRLLAGGAMFEPYLVLWDTSTWQPAQILPETSGVKAAAFNPSGTLLAVLTDAGQVQIWDVAAGTQLTTFAAPAGAFPTLAFSPDGRLLALSGDTVELWGVVP